MSKSFEFLDSWRMSINLAKMIYSLTKSYPKEETYGVISQMRRAAISIPSNIAEGSSRDSTKEFIHFIRISLGSLYELESLIILSFELKYINSDELNKARSQLQETGKLIGGLKRYLCKKIS